MRRIPALLVVAGLAAAPAIAVAGPSNDPWSTTSTQTIEKIEWSTSKGRLGVMVMSLTPELRKHFGAPADRGVLVAQVMPGTPAAAAGIEVGDVIVDVRDHQIGTAADVLSALAQIGKGDHAKVTLVRNNSTRTVDATLTDLAPVGAMWTPPWLRDWAQPFDGPSWFRDWMPPIDRAKPDGDVADGTSWLDRLRQLFTPKQGATNQRT